MRGWLQAGRTAFGQSGLGLSFSVHGRGLAVFFLEAVAEVILVAVTAPEADFLQREC